MLSYLIEKEFKQLFRNSFLPRLILLFPFMPLMALAAICTSAGLPKICSFSKSIGICKIISI